MAYFKTYRGGRLDLEFYKGKTSMDYPIEVFNDDDTEFDLTVYNDILFKIFHKRHGTVVFDIVMSDGNGDIYLYSPADNFVVINLSDSQIDFRPKEYWYECYGLRSDDEQELIFFGVANVI